MTRYPYQLLPAGDDRDAELPVEAYWIGLWYGGGLHSRPLITVSDQDPEIAQRIYQLCNRLNDSRPAWAAPLHVAKFAHVVRETAVVQPTCPTWDYAITSTVSNQNPGWLNSIVTGLRQLGVFATHKATGIPEQYLRGSKRTRAAVLAGLIDSDGSRHESGYFFSQCKAHLPIVEEFGDLAMGLGMRAHAAVRYMSRAPGNDQRMLPQWRTVIGGPNIQKVQSFVASPRKRIILKEGRTIVTCDKSRWERWISDVSPSWDAPFALVLRQTSGVCCSGGKSSGVNWRTARSSWFDREFALGGVAEGRSSIQVITKLREGA
jgi:hypothetical protein